MARWFACLATWCSRALGTWQALLSCAVLLFGWGALCVVSGGSDLVVNGGNAAISVVTLLMLFFLQASQNHDTAALNLKIDALIHALDRADDRLIGIENETDATIAAMKDSLLGAD